MKIEIDEKKFDKILDDYSKYVWDTFCIITEQQAQKTFDKYKPSLEQVVIHNNESPSLSITAKIPTTLNVEKIETSTDKEINININTSKDIYGEILVGQWSGIINVARRPEILNFFKIDKKEHGDPKKLMDKYTMDPTSKNIQFTDELSSKLRSF